MLNKNVKTFSTNELIISSGCGDVYNCIGGVTVSVTALSAVDRVFETWWVKPKKTNFMNKHFLNFFQKYSKYQSVRN
jgi:hypothetical protein